MPIVIIDSFHHKSLTRELQLWRDYDGEAEKAAQAASTESVTPLKPEYMDVIISDVRTKNGLSFSVQILNTEGKCRCTSRK